MFGKKTLAAALLVGAGFSGAAHAGGDALFGALVGGALGATIGHSVGGRDAAVVGGVIGAAAGASIAESQREYRSAGYYGSGRYAEPDAYYQAPRGRVFVAEAPRYYAPPVVYSRPAVRIAYVRDDYRDYGDRRDRRHDGRRDDGYRTTGYHDGGYRDERGHGRY